MDVWPYHEPIFPPETLPKMWEWMKEDGTLTRVFYEHNGAMTFPDLMRYFDPRLNADRLLLLFTTKTGDGAGFGWFDQVRPGLRASANVCMRKKYWGAHAAEAARISIDYIFGAFKVLTVFAVQPVGNRLGLGYSKRLGFKPLARIPKLVSFNGVPMDAMMTYLTRENWNGRT